MKTLTDGRTEEKQRRVDVGQDDVTKQDQTCSFPDVKTTGSDGNDVLELDLQTTKVLQTKLHPSLTLLRNMQTAAPHFIHLCQNLRRWQCVCTEHGENCVFLEYVLIAQAL